MSQAGVIDVEQSHPQIPTSFVTNNGTAIPIANTLEILGTIVAAHSIPLETTGTGNTITVVTQFGSASATSVANNAGLVSFNSAQFTVDANGFVSFTGAVGGETITGNTGGALTPTAGNWNIFGTSVAAGTTPVQTSGAVSTLTVQVQRSQAIAASDATKVGLANFNSTQFTVDANGFVSANGTGLGETITGNDGNVLSPTGGNWNIFGDGVSTSGVSTAGNLWTTGTGSTLTVQPTQAQFMTNYTSVAIGASPYTALATDYYISVVSAGGAITIKLPNAPTTNRLFIIKDKSGNASADNISVTTVGGTVTIDGQTTATIDSNFGSLQLLFDGTNYEIY